MNFEKIKKDIDSLKGTEYNYLVEIMEKCLNMDLNMRNKKIVGDNVSNAISKYENMCVPEQGRNLLEVLNDIKNDGYKATLYFQHPRFFSYVAPSVSPYAVIGQILQSIYNTHGGARNFAEVLNEIEIQIIKWLANYIGFDKNTVGGLFVSGGSIANMSSLITAREAILDQNEYGNAVIYMSEQSHSSNKKAIRLIGFRDDQIRMIPVDNDFRIKCDILDKEINNDIASGKKPAIIIGNLGTTNTGSIDDFDTLGEIAKKYKIWLHADGTYGASILLSDKYKYLTKGVENADSLSWDMHKWLMQCYSCSCFIIKNKEYMYKAFNAHHEYLDDATSATYHDPMDTGPELSRPIRITQFWITLQAMGMKEIKDLIDRTCGFAEYMYEEIKKKPNWKMVSKPCCAAITIRYEPNGIDKKELDNLNLKISEQINNDGRAYIVTTELNGEKVIRICTLNYLTTIEDINITLDCIFDAAELVAKEFIEKK